MSAIAIVGGIASAAEIVSKYWPTISGAIIDVEKIFATTPKSPATSATKLATAVSAISPIVNAGSTAGQIGAVSQTALEGAVESILAALKVVGSIPTNSATAVTGSSPATAVKSAGTLTIGG